MRSPDVPHFVIVPFIFVAFVDGGDVGRDGHVAARHDIDHCTLFAVVLQQLEIEVEVELGQAFEVVVPVPVGGQV